MARIASLMILPVLAVAPAYADLTGEIQKCGEIEDSAERLACFDGLSRPNPDPQSTTRDVEHAKPAAVENRPQPETPAPAPAAVPAASATAEPGSSDPVVADEAVEDAAAQEDLDIFGFENRALVEGEQQIQSRYLGEFRGWSGKTLFRLENGQVWQQAEQSRLVWRADNPVITIKKGVFGSFRLKVDGVNKSVKVKRVK